MYRRNGKHPGGISLRPIPSLRLCCSHLYIHMERLPEQDTGDTSSLLSLSRHSLELVHLLGSGEFDAHVPLLIDQCERHEQCPRTYVRCCRCLTAGLPTGMSAHIIRSRRITHTSVQVGGAAVFSIQAGLLTIFPGSISNFHNLQASWWFFAGWYLVNVLAVMVLFRDVKKKDRTSEADGERDQQEAASPDMNAASKEEDVVESPKGRTKKPEQRKVKVPDSRPGITRVQSLV
jgi:hypothetical protein